MRIVACSIVLVFAAFLPANASDIVAQYAEAIHAFNSQLQPQRCVALAHATIVAADREGLDARLLVALIAVESRWHPTAVSHAGAVGLAQFEPETAAGVGIDPSDPEQSIDGAARHLRALLRHYGSLDRSEQFVDAIAAYNAGAGAVDRYGGLPPYAETRAYVRDVIRLWRRLAGAG